MKKKIILAATAALAIAAAAAFVYANNKSADDDFWDRNAEALARDEGGGTASCYRASDYGPVVYGIFCDRRTQPPVIYPCTPPYSDRMGSGATCY